MSRLSHEFPDISIAHRHYYNGEGEPDTDIIEISVDTADGDSGFIVLDRPSDLYTLRDAIDSYILSNNVKPLTPEDDERKQ